MTEPTPDDPPVTPAERLDELVSAVLDGEATPEDAATVDGDPELRARLEEFRAVRSLLSTDPGAGTGPVLEDELARRRRVTSRRVAGAVGVAAAVTLLLVGVLSLFRTTDAPDVVATGAPPTSAVPSTFVAPPTTVQLPVEEFESAPLEEVTGLSAGRSPASLDGVAGAPAETGCAVVEVASDGTASVVPGAPCGPLQTPVVETSRVTALVQGLLASDREAVLRSGLGTGPLGNACALPTELGIVAVTDRAAPGVLVGLDATGTSTVVLDPTTCTPV